MPQPTSIECAPLLNPNGARSGHYMLPDVTGFADDFMRLQLGEQLYNVSSALVTLGKDVNAGVYTHTLLPGDCGTFALQSYMLQQGLDPALSGIAPEHVEVSSDPYQRMGKVLPTKVGDLVLMIKNIYRPDEALFHYAVHAGNNSQKHLFSTRKPSDTAFISKLGPDGPVVLSPGDVAPWQDVYTHITKLGKMSIQNGKR